MNYTHLTPKNNAIITKSFISHDYLIDKVTENYQHDYVNLKDHIHLYGFCCTQFVA